MVLSTRVIVGAVGKARQNVSSNVLEMLRTVIEELPHVKRVAISLRDSSFEWESIEVAQETSLPDSSIALGIAYSRECEAPYLAAGDPSCSFAAVSGVIFNEPDAPRSLTKMLKVNLDATGDIRVAFKRLVESLDGQYALVLKCGDSLLLARDIIGVKPLYLAEDDRIFAFSSRCRPLWGMSLTNCRNISQPMMISNNGISKVTTGIRIEPIRLGERLLIDSLTAVLSDALKKMLAKGQRIGILFSGGLDSSIIAKLSKDLGGKCTLYCAGTPPSRDMLNARRMSSALEIPLVEKELTYEAVVEHLPHIVNLIESTDMIRVSTSVPAYFAFLESIKNGEELVLHGQGADELYGGYERYENTLLKEGYAAACREMLDDVAQLKNTIPQYSQIENLGSVQLLAPFLDTTVVRFSLGIPIQLKLFREGSGVSRKHILRRVASKIGVPMEILPTQKVAIQFGSGVARIMDKIARTAGFSRRMARTSGFALPIQAYLKKIGEMARFPS
jgi:asparagine synthase (glutamine-hydrolysing)